MVEITKNALTTSLQALAMAIQWEEHEMSELEEGDGYYALAESVETYRKALNELVGVYEDARSAGAELPSLDKIIGNI